MTQQSSAMSITQLCHMDEPEEEANVRLESVEQDAVPSKTLLYWMRLEDTRSHTLFR